MPRKPASRSRGGRASEPAIAAGGDGVVARAVDRAFENPAMSGGLLVMALTATAIVTNAMFLQSGQHPEPLFTTRPLALPVPAVSAPSPRPAPPRDVAAAIVAAPPPTPAPTPAVAPPVPVLDPVVLVTDMQRELARLGLYVGSIDGIAGPRTEAAIAAYETAAGRSVTGEPSAELLAQLKAGPLPSPAPAASAPTAPEPTAPEPAAAAPEPAHEAPAVAATPATLSAVVPEEAPPAPPPPEASDVLRRVQTALNQAGYGPLAVDGFPGSETAGAIRRFELDNGLAITGEVGERLVTRLVAVGAMSAP